MTGNKIKMGRISYINASPIYYGLDNELDNRLAPSWLELVTDVPASLNQKILSGEIQISPISAAHYAMHHKRLLLLPDLSISCFGPVLSVLCASKVPLENLDGKKVMLSQESATGANLLKLILAKKQVKPTYVQADLNNISINCKKADAVMVIGDKALSLPWKDHFPYIFDLGQEWFEMTKLPFVFAVWVVDKEFAHNNSKRIKKVITLLHESRKAGYDSMEEIIDTGNKKLGLPLNLVKKYYNLLHCNMDEKKIQGMQLFFNSLFSKKLIPHKVKINFFDI